MFFANDVGITKVERFKEFPKEKIKQFSPHDVIKKPDIILQ